MNDSWLGEAMHNEAAYVLPLLVEAAEPIDRAIIHINDKAGPGLRRDCHISPSVIRIADPTVVLPLSHEQRRALT